MPGMLLKYTKVNKRFPNFRLSKGNLKASSYFLRRFVTLSNRNNYNTLQILIILFMDSTNYFPVITKINKLGIQYLYVFVFKLYLGKTKGTFKDCSEKHYHQF